MESNNENFIKFKDWLSRFNICKLNKMIIIKNEKIIFKDIIKALLKFIKSYTLFTKFPFLKPKYSETKFE